MNRELGLIAVLNWLGLVILLVGLVGAMATAHHSWLHFTLWVIATNLGWFLGAISNRKGKEKLFSFQLSSLIFSLPVCLVATLICFFHPEISKLPNHTKAFVITVFPLASIYATIMIRLAGRIGNRIARKYQAQPEM